MTKDYEITLGMRSNDSTQFFTINSLYVNMTLQQLVNTINLIIDNMAEIATLSYAYAIDDDRNEITFDEFPKPIKGSEDLKKYGH